MGNVFKSIFSKKMPKKQCKILMLGLDGAGKTTTLYALRLGQVIKTIPTIGFNVEELHYKTINMMVWDVGGQQKLRNLWHHYFDKAKGLIYVVDSSDAQRIQQTGRELKKILSHPDMKDSVVLVLANKRDLATLSLEDVCLHLGLKQIKRNWAIYPTVAIKEQSSGLQQAMEWLIDNIEQVSNPQKHIKVG